MGRIMRVGIYNRYLATLGGGERHGLAIAQALSDNHAVDVISHTPVTHAQIRARLDLDLPAVTLRVTPERPAQELGPLSAEYDLFINASNLDFIPAYAPRNALLVYFPLPAPTGTAARLRRSLGQAIRRWSGQARWLDGAYGVECIQGQTARGLAWRAVGELPPAGRAYTVAFAAAAAHPAPCTLVATVDGARALEFVLPPRRDGAMAWAPCRLPVPETTGPCPITLEVRGAEDAPDPACYVTPLQPSHTRYALYHRVVEGRYPELATRLLNPLPLNLAEIVRGYDLVWSISRFTQDWVRAYWGQDSCLFYPPVQVERFAPADKRPQIVSVGRFFAGGHNKKHAVMIEAFRKLVDRGLAGWTLHLAGGTLPGDAHMAYLDGLRRQAEGYPIVLHPDLAADRLTELYAASALYWHAAGYGESADRDPVRFEHFGITTVEAMAAGCAPIVLGRGGQTELIAHGQDGYLWYTTDELSRLTQELIMDPARRGQMAAAAQASSRRFDHSHFRARLFETLADLL
jgi:glycosyltransferase involved in cell wall biosynthesis